MRALDIIERTADPEGWPIEKRDLAEMLVQRVRSGEDLVFRYGPVVFTVGRDDAEVHMYSLGSGSSLLRATAAFHAEVWKRTGHRFLVSPIRNKQVQTLASRFGWRDTGERDVYTNYPIWRVERTH